MEAMKMQETLDKYAEEARDRTGQDGRIWACMTNNFASDAKILLTRIVTAHYFDVIRENESNDDTLELFCYAVEEWIRNGIPQLLLEYIDNTCKYFIAIKKDNK